MCRQYTLQITPYDEKSTYYGWNKKKLMWSCWQVDPLRVKDLKEILNKDHWWGQAFNGLYLIPLNAFNLWSLSLVVVQVTHTNNTLHLSVSLSHRQSISQNNKKASSTVAHQLSPVSSIWGKAAGLTLLVKISLLIMLVQMLSDGQNKHTHTKTFACFFFLNRYLLTIGSL